MSVESEPENQVFPSFCSFELPSTWEYYILRPGYRIGFLSLEAWASLDEIGQIAECGDIRLVGRTSEPSRRHLDKELMEQSASVGGGRGAALLYPSDPLDH